MTWRPTRALRLITGLDGLVMLVIAVWLSPPLRIFEQWVWSLIFFLTAGGLLHIAFAPANRLRRAVVAGLVTLGFGGLFVVQVVYALETGFTAIRLIFMTVWLTLAAQIVVRMSYWPAFDGRTIDDLDIWEDRYGDDQDWDGDDSDA